MEKEKLESMMIEFVDGTLNDADRQIIEQEIMNNPAAADLFRQTNEVIRSLTQATSIEPTGKLKTNFERMLFEEVQRQPKRSKVIWFGQQQAYRIAAGLALMLASGALFFWMNKGIQQDRELARLKTEMEATKTMMMTMLQNQSSAGQRIQGVSVAYQMKKTDDDIVTALVRVMDHDSNTNVRLAALEALSKFHEQPHVRNALIKSLTTQADPLVQIALIQLLVEIKETQSLKELQRMSSDENLLPAVQDEAHIGIMKLS